VLEAIAGVPLAPAALRAALTGCLADGDARSTRTSRNRAGGLFRDDEVYVHRDGDADPCVSSWLCTARATVGVASRVSRLRE
jgi:hypothetical protein